MNEQINGLWWKARIGYNEQNCDPEVLAKFTELIVRECLDIVNRKEYSYHEADPLWETSQLIKEHFGVE